VLDADLGAAFDNLDQLASIFRDVWLVMGV